jgi:ABC-type phosphate/phosphonate transport system substrate-binding protein
MFYLFGLEKQLQINKFLKEKKMKKTIMLGAVAYDAKVVPIWDIIRDYSNEYGVRLDYVLFSNYEAQIEALQKGMIDVAWNTNVAWVRTSHATQNKAKALVMRDTDIDFRSIFIANSSKNIHSIEDLKGKKFGLGSSDSAQASIIPYAFLQKEGLNPQTDLELVRFNSDLGKHGDTGRSEFDVLNAIMSGEIDAGAIGSTTWIRIIEEGLFPEGEIEAFYKTDGYCHCNFTVMPDADEEMCEVFTNMILSQDPREPIIKKMMIMEGLNKWVKVTSEELKGYDFLYKAMQEQELLENKI